MIIDEHDIKLLRGFYDLEEEEGLWELTKKLYPESKTDYEKKRRYIFLQRRAKRMGKDIFKIEKIEGSFSRYILTDNVKFCKRKFPNGVKNCLMILSEGKWMIIEL